jgi:hypothetical protein
MYRVASLVAELVAYAAVGCLYIYNSSGRQQKFISAGYLVLVLSAFLLSSIQPDLLLASDRAYQLSYNSRTIGPYQSRNEPSNTLIDYGIDAFVLGANLVAISTYCVWKLSFILPTLSNMVAIPLSRRKIIATILHAAAVTILLAVIVVSYTLLPYVDVACLVQLAAYNAVGCLYMCNSSRRKC